VLNFSNIYQVAIAPWGTNLFPGAGIIIYPAQNSSAILVGALFFVNAFPSFIGGVSSPDLTVSPNMMQSSRQAQYQHPMVTVPYYGSPRPPPHNSDPNSPVERPISNHGQDPFRYVLPRDGNLATYPNLAQGSSSAEAPWSNKPNNGNGYTYPSTHENPPYP
jgi:hypothetical protein